MPSASAPTDLPRLGAPEAGPHRPSMPVETPALYSARPAFALDGAAEASLSDTLTALDVVDAVDGMARCEAAFSNWAPSGDGSAANYVFFDRNVFDFGRALTVSGGAGEAGGTLFDGRITGIEAHYLPDRAPEVTVLAEDRLQDLRMTRRTRSFEDVTVGDVASALAQDHSLRTDLDVDGPTFRTLAQVNQSDLAFLRDLARMADAEAWVEGDTLHVVARARRDGGALTLRFGDRLHEFSVLADLATQRTAVVASGWDVAAKEPVSHEAGPEAVQAETASLEGGAAVLESAFGPRVDRVVHPSPGTQEQARALAEATFRQQARRFVSGQGTAEGDARLRVGATVTLEGLGALFAGDYTVVEARHTFSADGFRTRFRVERPGLGRP